MARLHSINARLSALPQTGKHIVYLVTEDRDFLEELFCGLAATMKALCGYAYTDARNWKDSNMFSASVSREKLVDLYDILALGNHRYFGDSANPPKDPLQKGAYFYCTDFHLLEEGTAGNLLKQFLSFSSRRERDGRPVYLFLLSPVLKLPDGFQQAVEIIDVPEMDADDILSLLLDQAREECSPEPLHPTEQARVEEAVSAFKGLSRQDILRVLHALQNAQGSFFGRYGKYKNSQQVLDAIKKERQRRTAQCKEDAARHDSTVTLLEPRDGIAGMKGYLSWLDDICEDFRSPELARRWASPPPKGVLLTGVPGSGKTQAAKKTAYEMGPGVSLVQFRMDNLLGGYVGDSEANFKRCRKRVEALAPCVVLMDEIEKTFDTKNSRDSSDVKMNILSALLDWMQETHKQIFFFATSNRIDGVPPELLRDGRLDMRFFAFMPTNDELVDILAFRMETANETTQQDRFHKFSGGYKDLAQDFLDWVAQYAEEEKKDLFYTGANIENLISQTNRLLRRKGLDAPSRNDYLTLLQEAASDVRSQPYGQTNMAEIVDSWLLARKNRYASAGGTDLLPFHGFREDTLSFDPAKLPACVHPYDKLLQRRLREEIEARYQKGRG